MLMCEDEGLRDRPSNGTVVCGVRLELSAFRRVEGIPFLKLGKLGGTSKIPNSY